jgi:hypothetical protein
MDRVEDIIRFYAILEGLETRLGGMRRLTDSSGKNAWPQRGVYFFFEPGEVRSSSGIGLRVVRVGTHALTMTSQTTLWHRLSQHRGTKQNGGGNHRGSIFRLIVGEALLQRDSLQLESWGVGQSAPLEIRQSESNHERRVSAHIGMMPFLWLDIPDEAEGRAMRGMIERNSIGLLSNLNRDVIDPPSNTWLGRFSPRPKVRNSGLWNQNHVDEFHNPEFLDKLDSYIELLSK